MTSSSDVAARGEVTTRRETAEVEAPQRARRPSWILDVVGIGVVVLVVLAGYFAVPFQGKTFSTALQVPGARICETASGACIGRDLDDPRVDYFAGASALDPWVHVVHLDAAERDLPLWNPYQGIGAPLAGNMQSSAFDPFLFALHVHPTPLLQDLTLLIGLMLIGAAAYFAARMLRLGVLAAVLTGSVYGLSGWFFVYSNVEWFRTYMYLPLLLAFVEWIIRSPRRLPVALLGLSVAGMLVVGMPEPAFMAMVATGLFALVRIFVGERSGEWWKVALRLAGGVLIGLALAAPLLALFREYLPLSYHRHANLDDKPPATDPLTLFLNWMMPRISPILRGDTRGNFSFTRNWVGAGAMVLAGVGLLAPRASKRRSAVWPLVVVGAVVTIQIYGGGLVGWTRYLPVWSQALWPAFGTPIIALVVALLAGVGVQALADRAVRWWQVLLSIGVVAVLAFLAVLVSDQNIALTDGVFFRGGWPTAVLVVGIIAVIACIPRMRSWAPLAVVAIVIVELVAIAPRGFYAPREDPFPKSGLTTFLTDHTGDRSRVFSTDGVLYPNTANAYGLSDLRMIDALYVDRYWKYLRAFVSHGILDRLIATGPTETAPAVASNPMFDILGVRYLIFKDSLGTGPPSWSGNQYRLVYEGDGAKVYENAHAMPSAFVAPRVHRVDDAAGALRYLRSGERVHFPDGSVQVNGKDPRQEAVVESQTAVPAGRPGCVEPPDAARIVHSTSDTVELEVTSDCGGVLVLSDMYYPGWKATVNGEDSKVYATDVALRGVAVPEGESRVVFRYEPSSFRLGLVAFAAGVIALLVLLVTGVLASGWWQRRRAAANA
jgi:hypothetical protein